MATKTFTLDPDNPPALSAEAKAQFDATEDHEIDYTDIPDMGDGDRIRQSATEPQTDKAPSEAI